MSYPGYGALSMLVNQGVDEPVEALRLTGHGVIEIVLDPKHAPGKVGRPLS